MSAGQFAVIQYDPSIRPSRAAGRIGVLEPINMDGFYADLDSAHDVAEYMAECNPHLRVLVVEVSAHFGTGLVRQTPELEPDDFDGIVIESYSESEAEK
jgi:hypothetical protein